MLRRLPTNANCSSLLLLSLLLFYFKAVESAFRKNYVIERNESWNGHVYLVREEQPFFRVYHAPHSKATRDNPNAGRLAPMQNQLVEEQGSDQRLRMAAEFWHQHNKEMQQQQEQQQQRKSQMRHKRKSGTPDGETTSEQSSQDPKAMGDGLAGTTTTKEERMRLAQQMMAMAQQIMMESQQQQQQQSSGMDQQQGGMMSQQQQMMMGQQGMDQQPMMGQQQMLGKEMVSSGQQMNNGQQQQMDGQAEEQLSAADGHNTTAAAESQQQPKDGDEAPALQVLERNQSRTSAKFGHHHLPTGEQKDSATWPSQLMPYMPCLTLECVCPLFRGKVKDHKCILPTGKPLRRAVRKEFRQYSAEEMALFMEVMRRFKRSGLYSRLGMIHRRSGVHSGPSFFPWHREFLKRLELVFRALHPEDSEPILGLPYWDSSLDGNLPAPEDSIIFSDYLLGEPDDSGFITTGLFANWTTMDGRRSFQRMFGDQIDGEFFNQARIDFVLSQTSVDRVMAFSLPLQTCNNYEMDDRFLEYSHDYVHYFISGDMQERFSSSNDPIFFMHHAFVDSVWEMWRQQKQSRLQRERDYPRDDGECMPEWHFSYAYMPLLLPLRNLDALSNNYTDHMFEYAPRPSCDGGRSEECGNMDFLWCDTQTHPGHPICSAKVKPGGNCQGFEWSTDACYKGQCLEGRCTRVLGGEEQQKQQPKDGNPTRAKLASDGGGTAKEVWHTTSFMR